MMGGDDERKVDDAQSSTSKQDQMKPTRCQLAERIEGLFLIPPLVIRRRLPCADLQDGESGAQWSMRSGQQIVVDEDVARGGFGDTGGGFRVFSAGATAG